MNEWVDLTPFTEANAILAAQSGTEEEVHEILKDSSDSELRVLEKAAERLAEICYEVRRGGK